MSASWALILIVGLVALQRLGELLLAQRNTVRLLSEGAVESGARHYPLFVALHTGWLVAIVVFAPADTSIDFRFLAAFAILQAARIWVIPCATSPAMTSPANAASPAAKAARSSACLSGRLLVP